MMGGFWRHPDRNFKDSYLKTNFNIIIKALFNNKFFYNTECRQNKAAIRTVNSQTIINFTFFWEKADKQGKKYLILVYISGAKGTNSMPLRFMPREWIKKRLSKEK